MCLEMMSLITKQLKNFSSYVKSLGGIYLYMLIYFMMSYGSGWTGAA